MSTLRFVAVPFLACVFLSACTTRSAKPQLTIKPVTEIRHSGGASAAAHYERGTYYQRRGNLDLALNAYVQALNLDSRHVEARNAMATIYSQQGKFAEAESVLREAVAQSPGAAHLHNNLGYIHYLQGNHELAIKELRTALSLDANNEWARNNLQMAQIALGKRSDKLVEHAKTPSAPVPAVVTPLQLWGEPDGAGTTRQTSANEKARDESANEIPIVPAASTAAAASNEFRLEISNGSGVTGLAKRLSQLLSRLGIPVFRLTNQQPYRQIVTEIQYKDGFKPQAEKLMETLRGRAIVSRMEASPRPVDIRVVLGKDIKTHMGGIEKEEPTRVAISKPGTNQLQ